MDYRLTTHVVRKKKRTVRSAQIFLVTAAFICLMFAVSSLIGFLIPAVIFGVLAVVIPAITKLEYDYVLENGVLSIDVIRGKRIRRRAHELKLEQMEVAASNWHDAVAKYRIAGGTVRLPKYDYTSYNDNIPYYTMIFEENGRKIKLLLDLNSEMMQLLGRLYPDRVYFE